MVSNDSADWEKILAFLKPRPPLFCPHEPTPKQQVFLRSEALEVLFGGHAGGGKSDALLMAALQYVDIPHYAAVIFRNTFADLALPGSLMTRSHEWLDEIKEAHWDPNRHSWKFPSGATLTFGYLDKPNDYLRYKSAEFQYVGFDEVTEIREKHYRYLFSRLRRPSGRNGAKLAKVPLRMRCASNPAPNWVRRRFIEEGKNSGRLYIPASLGDNPFVDHTTYLNALSQLDDVERARLERGDWYAEETGSKFKREWFEGKRQMTSEQLPKVTIKYGIETHLGGRFEKVVRYWDTASTLPTEQNPDPDWTVGALVGLAEGKLYILDIQRFRKDPAGVEKHIRAVAEKDGPLIAIRMEQEPGASGKISIDHYARYILLGFDFDGLPAIRNKEARADLWAGKARRGEVILRTGGVWITDFLDEIGGFPESAPHDDQVDAVSGANEILTGLGVKIRRPLEIIV